MLLVGRQEGHLACKKTEWWGAGVVICLERGTDLHMAQLMSLPLTVSCFSEIQTGFTFLVPAHPGSLGQRAVIRVCVGCSCCVLCCVQLVNLRDVVARMLGLSLHSLAVPDYELISRLEQLILANQANVSAAVALESALVSSTDQLGEGFQAGYRHAGRALAPRGARGGVAVAPPAGVTSAVQRQKVEAGLC